MSFTKNKITFICSVILCSFFFVTLKTSASTIFYVAQTGNNAEAGSYEAPWRTIQHAINQVTPGDTIYVREGIYEELINIDKIGNIEQGLITIQPYKNEKVVIDGQNVEVTNSNRAAFSIKDAQGISIQGFEIRNITTNNEDHYPAGVLIRGASKHIELLNNNIHHIANYAEEGNAHGIIVYGNRSEAIHHITIRKNEVHHLTLGSSESLTFSGNITDFVIDHNFMHNNNNIGIDIAGYYNACEEVDCIDFSRKGIISNNVVIKNSSAQNIAYGGDNSAAGIYIDGSKDIEIINNLVSGNDYGISISSENYQQAAMNITVRNNFIMNNHKAGLVIGGSSKDNGGAHNNLIEENLFISNDRLNEGYREISVQYYNVNNTFKDNTYYVCSTKDYINESKDAYPQNHFKNETVKVLHKFCPIEN